METWEATKEEELWERFYRNKIDSRARARGRCEYCGRRGSTATHHLWIRRWLIGDDEYLQSSINTVQLCAHCHMQESEHMQIVCSVRKLHEYGPEEVEQYILDAPTTIPPDVPHHLVQALEYYRAGKEPDDV